MRIFKLTLLAVAIIAGLVLYKDRADCKDCLRKPMEVERRCIEPGGAFYFKLSCFCDDPVKWKQLADYIKLPVYKFKVPDYRILNKDRKYDSFYWGIDEFSCGHNSQPVIPYEHNPILFIIQNIDRPINDGALNRINFEDEIKLAPHWMEKYINVDGGNRVVDSTSSPIKVIYTLDYGEINGKSLLKFKQAVNFDSTYRRRYEKVDYQLVNKDTGRHEASFRYEGYGKWFYFDVY